MAKPKKITEEVIHKVAGLRARGSGWTAIVEELGYPLDYFLTWVRDNREEWLRALRRAFMEVIDESLAEALGYLRKLLRSQDPDVVAKATKQLLDFRIKVQESVEQDEPGHGVDSLLQELLGSDHDLKQLGEAAGE